MNRKFSYVRRARDDERLLNNCEIIDLDAYQPNKAIVLVFGGNGTGDNKMANGYGKFVSKLIGVFRQDVDIISISYNQALGEPYMTENCTELVKKLFVPLVSNKRKRVDIDTACKNMRQINVFAHCRGVDGPMKRIVPALYNELIKLKYTAEERELIISQIVMVAYGAHNKDTIDEIKAVYCLGFRDQMYSQGAANLAKEFLNKLDVINIVKTDKMLLNQINTSQPSRLIRNKVIEFLTKHKRVYNIRENNSIHLFSGGLVRNSDDDFVDDHLLMGIERNNRWHSGRYATSTGDCVSRCLACALCNAVANSILNRQLDEFVNFDINLLQYQIDDICRHYNYNQTNKDEHEYI